MKTLDELDRLHAAAAAGEWEVTDHGCFWRVHSACDGFAVFDDGSACGEYSVECTPATRDAIVALHNAWPSVSARLRAAEAEVERLRALSAEARDMLRDMPWRRGGDALVARLDRAALGEP